MIELRTCRLEYTPEGAVTHFPDGTKWGAVPHDDPHYHAIAHRLGYEGDILRYAREHELAHHCVAEHFNSHSPILWALAHGEKPPALFVPAEEALAMALQRYARAREHPLVDGMDWALLRARFLSLAEQADA